MHNSLCRRAELRHWLFFHTVKKVWNRQEKYDIVIPSAAAIHKELYTEEKQISVSGKVFPAKSDALPAFRQKYPI